MDKSKFTNEPLLDSEGFRITEEHEIGKLTQANGIPIVMTENGRRRLSPWALLDQDHLDRIFDLWKNSAPAMQAHLQRLHDDAVQGA